VVLGHLIAFTTMLTDEKSSGITQIGSIANIIVDKNYQGTAATIVALLFPFMVSLNESFPQSIRNIFSPIEIEKYFMKPFLEKLGTFRSAMTIIYTEPLSILLEINCYFILVSLAI